MIVAQLVPPSVALPAELVFLLKLSRYFVLDETFNLQILEQCSGAVD